MEENKFGAISPAYKTLIHSANSKMLLTWSERILTVKTIVQLFNVDH